MALDLSGVRSRPYRGDEDLLALVDLINAAGRAEGNAHVIKAENVKQFLGSPRVEPPQLWENGAGQLLINVTLRLVFIEEGEDRSLEVRTLLNVRPEARGHGLEDRVIDWCVEQARELGKTPNKCAWGLSSLGHRGNALLIRQRRLGFSLSQP
jgi:GNAT superfamily N-acetyltransferase